MSNISISEFLNTRYRDYCHYVLYSRAIPSVIDGLKPSQRKIMYTADKVAKSSLIKNASLAGDVISKGNYHHGNAALEDAINGMIQEFKNNIPWLKGKGTFGSRLVPEAAAARYTYSRVSPNFYKYFNDFEICESSNDPEDPEPRFYLPIIPTILVNGTKGIAVGFATEIQPRNPTLLTKAIAMLVKGHSIDNMNFPPYYEGFKGTVYKNPLTGKYQTIGIFNRQKKNNIQVTELPWGMDREKYVSILHKLEDDGVIRSFKDMCSKVGFQFDIKLINYVNTYTAEELSEKLKLIGPCTDTLTLIDPNGAVKIYDNIAEIIKEFYEYRVLKYKERYEFWHERDRLKKRKIDIKISFVKAIIADKIKVKGISKEQLKTTLAKTNLDSETIDGLIRMPMYSLCQDGLEDLQEQSLKYANAMETWSKAIPRKEYFNELKGLL